MSLDSTVHIVNLLQLMQIITVHYNEVPVLDTVSPHPPPPPPPRRPPPSHKPVVLYTRCCNKAPTNILWHHSLTASNLYMP